jgi:hypothetical protein
VTAEADRDAENQILAEVFQVLKKRQRAPPPGGYMFSKNDHVTTKMGRLPPSPCKCCGSDNHWDKECPDIAVYLEKTAKSGYSTEAEKEDEYYHSAYSILLSQRVASMQVDHSKLTQDFDSATQRSSIIQTTEGCKSDDVPSRSVKPVLEEVEDEFWKEEKERPKTMNFLMYRVDDLETAEQDSVTKDRPQPSKHPTQSGHHAAQQDSTTEHSKPKKKRKSVTMEEVEDQDITTERLKPKSPKHLLISVDNESDEPGQPSKEEETEPAEQKEAHHTFTEELDDQQP